MARETGIERLSPLEPVYRSGPHGRFEDGVEVALSEIRPGSIVQVTAWPGEEQNAAAAIRAVTGLSIPDEPGGGVVASDQHAFGIGPGKFIVIVDSEKLTAALLNAIPPAMGAVTDLSHGRTIIRIEGPKAEWVLAKFFAIDFALTTFPLGAGRSTSHHDIFAQIQRTGPDRFDICVFRSFARSFWEALCRASAEVGYEVQ